MSDIAPASSGTRFVQSQSATVNAAGVCTFTFNPPTSGYILTGTIVIAGSPPGTLWVVQPNDSPTPITVIRGANPAYNIQALDRENIVVTGIGLTPNAQFTATYSGINSQESVTSLLSPVGTGQDSIVSPAARLIGTLSNFPGDGTNISVICNLQQTDRSLVIIASASSVTEYQINVIGLQSTIDWTEAENINVPSTNTFAGEIVLVIPCYGALDSQVQVFGNTVNDDGSPTIYILAVPDEILNGNFSNAAYQKTVPAQGGSDIVASVSAATGTNETLLDAPSEGTGYWIKFITVRAPTTVANATDISVQGLSTAAGILVAFANVGGIDRFVAPTEMVIDEGLLLHNTTAVTAAANVWYQQVNLLA